MTIPQYKQICNISVKQYIAKSPKKVLVCVHGFAGDKESSVICEIAENLTEKGVNVIAFDLPCHGTDLQNKNLRVNDCLQYVETIYDYAKTFGLPISFFATSFGAFLLLNFIGGKKLDIDKIVLRAPAINMGAILETIILEHGFEKLDIEKRTLNLGYEKEIFVDKNFKQDLEKNNLQDFVNNYYFYIIQGKKDDVVDYKYNEKFFDKFCKNKHKYFYFENADHRFKNIGEKEKIVQIVENILK